MIRTIRARITYANVTSTLALFLALGTGTAYAANEWTGVNIVDGSLTAQDLAVGTIGTLRILDQSLQAVDLAQDSVGASEIAAAGVGSSEIATDAVGALEIADGSIDGGEVINESLGAIDLAPNSVGASEIATGAVGTAEVAPNSLTAADLAGGQSSGSFSLSAGAVANGRCVDFEATVSGAVAGDAVVVSLDGPAPQGILFYGVRSATNGHATVKVCNLSGAAMPAITNLPVSIITISL